MRAHSLPRVTGLLLASLLLPLAMAVPAMARHNFVAATVTAENVQFNPTEVTIPAGSNVLFKNQEVPEGPPHTLSGTDGRFDSGLLFPGDEMVVSTEHLRPGSYAFFCRVHPDVMLGTLTVELPG